MSERYVIISADGHCGLPLADYRPVPRGPFHPAFDEWLARKEDERAKKLESNFEYIMGWETANEEGLQGAYDPAVRDKELDADGVSADVLFADADAITGMGSPPFGAGLRRGRDRGSRTSPSPAPTPTTASWPSCARRSPHRRARHRPRPDLPRPVRARGHEIEWVAAQPGIRGVMIPTMWRDRAPYSNEVYEPVLGGVRRGRPAGAHPLGRGTARRSTTTTSASTWPRWSGGRRGRPGTCSSRGAFERHPDLKFVVTEAAAYWVADLKWKWDQYMGGGHTTKKMAALLEGKISKLPSDYFGTNLFIGASTMSKEEIRRRHVIGTRRGDVGHRLPAPRGHRGRTPRPS